jgi:uncharacterized LabA/DUF88 family protein
MVEDRLKIAVFVDFDNIEIGVKSTLNRHFDIGAVLEAIKERGEVVTKIAYGDWKRAGEHSRSMTQHAIQMVQRNLTPGGDKNGADINLALDALEMAFTRNHINAFVIVGGDSDFIALVEKLKQYDKKVLVVGGRSFTSAILQKNCHEFIAYENLIAPQRRPAERTRVAVGGDSNLAKPFPLVRRALKILNDREVSPQLGLLKSTLLQLDSTFTERDYGASTFRDFIEKMAAAGYVNLKQVDRSLLVELKDQFQSEGEEEQPAAASAPVPANGQSAEQPVHVPPPAPSPTQVEEGIRAMQEAFQNSKIAPHWPMYLRNVKQFIKNSSPTFDEHRYGFHSFLDAVRSAQRAGLFRLERNRQGILRVYPGNQISQMQRAQRGDEFLPAQPQVKPYDVEDDLTLQQPEPETSFTVAPAEEIAVEAPADVEPQMEEAAASVEEQPTEKPARKRRVISGIKRKTVTPRKSAGPASKRSRKKTTPSEEETVS